MGLRFGKLSKQCDHIGQLALSASLREEWKLIKEEAINDERLFGG